MLIEGPEERWASLRRLFGRREDHGVVGARPNAPTSTPPRATARPARTAPAETPFGEWRKWPPMLLARDLFLSWLSDWIGTSNGAEIKLSEGGVSHEGQILGRLPWSAVARVDVGFARDGGGAALVLTPDADVSPLLSIQARTDRRLTLASGWGPNAQRNFVANVRQLSPGTEIRQPENGGLVAPLTGTLAPADGDD